MNLIETTFRFASQMPEFFWKLLWKLPEILQNYWKQVLNKW